MWVRHRKIAAYSTEFMLLGCLPSAVFLFLYQSGDTTCTMKVVLRKIWLDFKISEFVMVETGKI